MAYETVCLAICVRSTLQRTAAGDSAAAAEGGVLAASLAADGFTGPRSVLEGEAGS